MSYLLLDQISKWFDSFRALDQVHLEADRGSIHAVLGENGAGKTTLMNILFGLYRPDAGRIVIDGRPIALRSPADAIRNGIGMIHQHFHLANALTVAENIALGLGRGMRSLDLRAHASRIRELGARYGLQVDPDLGVWALPMGMRQRVEILRALYRDAKVLVLDEPTSVLAPDEIASFLAMLRTLRDAGVTILLVTHKLDEVMDVSDAITILRSGRVVASVRTKDTNTIELSKLMVGRDITIDRRPRAHQHTKPLLECRDLVALDERRQTALNRLSLDLHAGEILGIAGVDGNGQRELAEVIAGLRSLRAGTITVLGKPIDTLNVSRRMSEIGIGFVPEDRHGTGLVLDHSIASNLALRRFYRPPLTRWGLLARAQSMKDARGQIERYDIRVRSPSQPARVLSGGNQQKVVLARELDARPRILVVSQPTKGLDVGAIDYVHRALLEQRERGVGTLYISTELEHLLAVSDRVAVIHRGRIMGVVDPASVSAEQIGLMMGGAQGIVA